MAKILNWHTGPGEALLISEITARALDLLRRCGSDGSSITPLEMSMDLTACHLNGCPLQLAELLAADDFDFSHDVFGIRKHINRQTGKLGDCFDPRYAVRS